MHVQLALVLKYVSLHQVQLFISVREGSWEILHLAK